MSSDYKRSPWIILVHWTMALAIVLNHFLLEDDVHNYIGYLAVILVLARAFKGDGHKPENKLAKAVYFAIWGLVLGLGVSGFLLTETDRFFGDESMEEIHEYMSDGIMVLVAIHLTGIGLDSFKNKRKTWMRMIRN